MLIAQDDFIHGQRQFRMPAAISGQPERLVRTSGNIRSRRFPRGFIPPVGK